MALPPLTYFLLVGTTLLVAPFILKTVAVPSDRRFASRMLAGLLAFQAGLVLLFYAKALCWPLVAVGVALIGSLWDPGRSMRAAAAFFVVAIVAGVGFELLDGARAFYFYFGLCIPLLLLASMAGAISTRIGTAPSRRILPAAAVLSFAAFTPASAFGFDFLFGYEVYHLPVLLLSLWGIHAFVASGKNLDRSPLDLGGTLGDRMMAPWSTRTALGGPLILAGLAIGSLALRHAPLPAPFATITWGLVIASAAVGLLLLLGVAGKARAFLMVLAALAASLAGLFGVRFGAEAFHLFVGGGPAPETVYFYLAAGGLLLFSLVAALGLARVREMTGRRRMAEDPRFFVQAAQRAGSPEGFIELHADHVPQVDGLVDVRERIQRSGRSGGVLFVASAQDPTAGLPIPVERWLHAQDQPPYVHLALREGKEVFYVPFIDPREVEA